MKVRYLLFAVCTLCCSDIIAQANSPYFSPEQIQEDGGFVSYVSASPVSVNYGLPITREIKGGTKIIPVYEDELRNEAKGALELACKIWEEVLPTTFPIHIRIKVDSIKTNVPENVFSSVRQNLKVGYCTDVSPSSNLAQIKATMFGDRANIYRRNPTYNEPSDTLSFLEAEMDITYYNYNNRLYDNCSFSLDGVADDTKYDFVTMVLRDIARGLGACCSYCSPSNTIPKYLRKRKNNIIPFESLIDYFLPNDSCQAFQTVTQGTFNLGPDYELYAPSTWSNNVSLNYFVPNQEQKITRLLDHNFGKGSVIRDISSDDVYRFVKNTLYWTSNDSGITTGGNESHTEKSVSTANGFAYHGSISPSSLGIVSQFSISSLPTTNYSAMVLSHDNMTEEEVWLENYMQQFLPRNSLYFNGVMHAGIAVSFLLDDGTWDDVYHTSFLIDEDIDYESLSFHYPATRYSRTCDGKLRCRITKGTRDSFYNNRISTRSWYYVMDELPQKVKMKMSKVIPDYSDEYIRDIQIGIKNLEGTNRVVVSQWFEGDYFPYTYEVHDFEKGYFTASVDKEFSSTFMITAYNDNGYTYSDTIVIDPLEPVSELNLQFRYNNGFINIGAESQRLAHKNLISSFEIKPLNRLDGQQTTHGATAIMMKKRIQKSGNQIDVSSLPKGVYALIVYDIKGGRHEMKFIK